MASPAGIEPVRFRITAVCSTAELRTLVSWLVWWQEWDLNPQISGIPDFESGAFTVFAILPGGAEGGIRTLTSRGHWILNPARLPITPPRHGAESGARTRKSQGRCILSAVRLPISPSQHLVFHRSLAGYYGMTGGLRTCELGLKPGALSAGLRARVLWGSWWSHADSNCDCHVASVVSSL